MISVVRRGPAVPTLASVSRFTEVYKVHVETVYNQTLLFNDGFEEMLSPPRTAAGASEVRDPIAGRVVDIRRRRSGAINRNRLTGQHPTRTGDPFESEFGPLVW